MANFLLGTVITLGVGLIGSAFTSRKNVFQSVEKNKQESFSEPKSSYGDYIPRIWGKGRVGGILVWAKFPPEERVSVSTTNQLTGGKGTGAGGGQTTTTEERTYSYYGNCAFMFSQVVEQNALKELRLNGHIFKKDNEVNPKYHCITRFYEGTNTQNVDTLLYSINNEAIPYRLRSYIVIENLPLEDFGNGYPQASATIENGTPSLAKVIRDICLESPDINSNEIDVSELEDIQVTGFQVDRQMSILEKLSLLQKIYFFDLVDSGDKLKFQKQLRPYVVAYIPPEDLASHESGTERPKKYKETRADLTTLPTQYEIKFLDVNNNLLQGLERSPQFWDKTINIETIDYSGVLSQAEAKEIVNRLLWLDWERSFTQEFQLSLKYVGLEPGDVVEIEVNGIKQQVQIKEISLGANNLLLVKSWNYRAVIHNFGYTAPFNRSQLAQFTGNAINLGTVYQVLKVGNTTGTIYTEGIDYTVNLTNGTITPINGGSITNGTNLNIDYSGPQQPKVTELPTPSNTTLRVLDLPQVYPADTKGIYVFGDGDSKWRNAAVYISRNGGSSYTFGGSLVTRSLFGITESILGDFQTLDQKDTTNHVDIVVPAHTELSSISQTDFLLGVNRALIGTEILDFQTANLLGLNQSGGAAALPSGDRSYRLSNFTRGIRGTYNETATHLLGERFYLLSGYKLILSETSEDLGKTLYFKAISQGQTLEDVNPVTLTIVGNAFKSWIPTITSFSPTQGSIGTTLKVFGTGFIDASQVNINGTIGTNLNIVNDGELSVIVGAGTTTGKITVVATGGTGLSIAEFVISSGTDWGEIGGTLTNQTDLVAELEDIRAYALIMGLVL